MTPRMAEMASHMATHEQKTRRPTWLWNDVALRGKSRCVCVGPRSDPPASRAVLGKRTKLAHHNAMLSAETRIPKAAAAENTAHVARSTVVGTM